MSGIISTSTLGTQTVTFTVFDLAGNSASLTCTYEVIFAFSGFYPTVKPAPAINLATAGSTISIKFSLAGNQGLNILAAGYPTAQQVNCKTLDPVEPAFSITTPGKSGLSYNLLREDSL